MLVKLLTLISTFGVIDGNVHHDAHPNVIIMHIRNLVIKTVYSSKKVLIFQILFSSALE